MQDETCDGRIEAALSPHIPIEDLSLAPSGALYYAGVNTEEAYRPLCRSHHVREGNLSAGVRRSPVVARAVRVEAVRNDHQCDDGCDVCEWLRWYDKTIDALIGTHVHVVPRRPDDGLPLPWTPQQQRRETPARNWEPSLRCILCHATVFFHDSCFHCPTHGALPDSRIESTRDVR